MLSADPVRASTPFWYAIWTRSRHEKQVRDQLDGRGIEPLLPLVTQRHQWKDRKKDVDLPLFPGYCFARFAWKDSLCVLKAPGVVQVIGGSGHPEPIPEDEIQALKTLMIRTLPYDPHPYLREGMQVEVVRGPLKGIRGILVRKEKRQRLVISVHLIQQAASVEIDSGDIAAY